MAIVTETFTVNNTQFIRTYSDAGFLIHGGSPEGDYSEACDPASLNRTYTETNIPIDSGDSSADSETADKAEAYDILMGVEE